jgi:hypothetical protein
LRAQTYLYLGGMIALLLGERVLGAGQGHLLLSGAGVLLVLAALGLTARDMGAARPDQRDAHRQQLIAGAVGVASLLLYLASTDLIIDKMSLSEDGEHRLVVALSALWPIVWLAGTMPFVAIDRALAESPVAVVPARVRELSLGWLSAAFALAMLFPINFIAADTNERWELGYFKTAEPGTATLGVIGSLEVPVTAYLFFPAASDVTEEVRIYFDQLQGGNLTVEYVDHALDPELAKELKVRNNGYVVFVRGEGDDQQIERIKIGEKFDSAKRALKKLDGEVYEALLKVARGPRIAYLTVGHGEMYWSSDLSPDRKINDLKKVLRQLNFSVRELGLTNGLASDVPEDATVVIVLSPESALLDEEIATLNAYRERGGAMLIALDPGGPELTDLLTPVGVGFDPAATLVIDANFIPLYNGPLDRVNIATNKFSSHGSVTTLSRNSKAAFVITPAAGVMEKLEPTTGKNNTTMRALAATWADYNNNLKFDATLSPAEDGETSPAGEERKEWPLAIAASGPSTGEQEFRVVVTADATWVSDFLLLQNKGNAQLLIDSLSWLIDDEASAGTVNDEKDIKIQHTKEGQGWIFYSTTFLLPLLLLIGGLARVRTRQKRS